MDHGGPLRMATKYLCSFTVGMRTNATRRLSGDHTGAVVVIHAGIQVVNRLAAASYTPMKL
jgi:hypothetical protein